MDMICPPSTVFAVHNYVRAPKKIDVYDFNQHEGGAEEHTLRKIHYLAGFWD
jgi:cephalosporin-C deacetylase